MRAVSPGLAFACAFVWAFVAAAQAPAAPVAGRDGAAIDGPYVFGPPGAREQLRLERRADGIVELVRSRVEGELEVALDEAQPRTFRVPLRDAYPRPPVEVPAPERVFVASDFEGEFDAFTGLMQAHGVIDADWRWRYGRGHLVLVGDLVDRGRNVVPLLWLVYRLEAEAAAAGGALHYVLGNHEHMLLGGRARDAHPKYHATLQRAGTDHRSLWNESTELGRWLRSKPVLLKVGDTLFMHGGVSPQVLALRPALAEVDALAAAAIAQAAEAVVDARARALLLERTGVLWYRGLAMALDDMPRAGDAHVDAVLAHFDVRRLAIGHTLVRAVGHDYDGRVLRIDVHHAGGTSEAVLIEGDTVQRLDAAGDRHPLEAAVNLD